MSTGPLAQVFYTCSYLQLGLQAALLVAGVPFHESRDEVSFYLLARDFVEASLILITKERQLAEVSLALASICWDRTYKRVANS